MELYQSISKRKSCRKYSMEPLDAKILEEIQEAIKDFEPLYPTLPIQHRFSTKVKGKFMVSAPHYLILSGSDKEGELEQAGFLFEQLVLWLDTKGIGSVWLGSAKDQDTDNQEQDIIALAIGTPTEPVHRTKEEFSRKPIEEITNTPDDTCIQAVHLAPSGMNLQPWFFQKEENKVYVYQKKLKQPIAKLYKLLDLDMGIALSHYAIASRQAGKHNFMETFQRTTALPEKKGYLPFGIIEE